jgi:type IV pilus assembly protein PilX
MIHYSEKKQQGAVLIMALILMTLMLFIGVSGAKMIASNEVITGNFVDRSMAFQDAEAALVAGQNAVFALDGLASEEASDVADCMPESALECDVVPPDAGYGSIEWHSMTEGENNALRSGLTPQYYMERIAEIDDEESQKTNRDAESNEYNIENVSPVKYVIYRVTARSNAPAIQEAEGRSVVMLQSLIKRTY